MIDLQTLYNYLVSKGSPLALSADDTSLQKQFQDFIGTMPDKKISIVPGENGITLKDKLLTISGATSDKWKIQGLKNVTVPLSSLLITIDNGSGESVIKGSVNGQMEFAPSVKAGVIISSTQQKENPWDLTLADNVSNVTPLQVLLMGSKFGKLPFNIPDGMDFLSKALVLDKQSYNIIFYPNTEAESDTTFTLNVPAAKWTPVPDIFSFDSLDLLANMRTNSTGIVLRGRIKVGSTSIDAGIGMTGSPNWTVFIKPTPPAEAFPGLAALAKWIGGASLDNAVNKGFSDTKLTTSGFDLAISGMIASIDIKKFKLNDLTISSILTLGAMKLDVVLSLPAININGSLHGNEPVKVTDFLSSLSLPTATVPADLAISKASFSAQLKKSTYAAYFSVENIWSAGPLTFKNIDLSLAYAPEPGVTGTFGAGFLIEKAKINLLAEYGGAEEGWVFSGGLDPETPLKIGDLIAMLAKDFGISSVPEPIRSLEVTELFVSYASVTKNFEFRCGGGFKVDDKDVKMEVVIKVQKGDSGGQAKEGEIKGTKGYNAFFSGNITINKLAFDVVFDTNGVSQNVFIASFHNTEAGKTPLKELVSSVSTTLGNLVPASLVIDLKEVKFIYLKQNTEKQFAFGLDLKVGLNLSDLPVIGKKLPDGLSAKIDDLEVLYASKPFTKEQVKIINPLLPKGILKLNDDGVSKGVLITGELVVADYKIPINTGSKKPAPKTVAVESFTGTLAATNPDVPSPITWFNVDKQLGPFKFNRIGVEYQDNVLSFALDAALTMGPATLGMQGLSMGSSLSKFSPVFGLNGFSLDINTGSLEVGGAFLKAKTPDGATGYYGMVIIKFGNFGIKALGGDVPAHEADDPNNPGKKIKIPASFFIYANVTAPLGGPPFLYLNGFAGGFGINNSLKLPTLENLPGYILLPGPGSKAPAEGKTPVDTIATVLPKMQQYFVPQPGQYWMAAGIAFSSFQMINAFALVTVSFGVDFQVALLGSASMNFPTGAPKPIAYIEIDIMASYSTSSGLFAVEGIVSPASYIFGDFCKITGGFAFYIWINPPVKEGGPRPGDFVVTMGGYHPAFKPPTYYPKVPRLGINFSLGPFHVTGGCYFALTPGMFMAGASMKASWDVEIVKAWFIIGADFLIAWAPFHYEAGVYVSMGCSVNLGLFTLNVSVGADLYIWGPPFGGRADVDLDVISFTIHFGSKEQEPEPIDWKQFREKFLPSDTKKVQPAPHLLTMAATLKNDDAEETNILKSTVPAGLNSSDVDGFNWILDPDHFVIQVSTNIPVNQPLWTTAEKVTKEISNLFVDYNASPVPIDPKKWPYLVYKGKKFSDEKVWNPKVNVKPMKVNDATSILTVVLMKSNESGVFDSYVTALTVQPVVQNAVAALWSESTDNKPAVDDPSYQKSSLIGFRVTPLPRIPNMVYGVRLTLLLYQQGNNYYFNYQKAKVDTNYKVTSEGRKTDKYIIKISGQHTADLPNENYILQSLVDPWVASQRSSILANLKATGFSTYEEVNLKTFAKDTALTNWPVAMLLGDSFPS